MGYADRRRLEAFDVWCYRRVMRICRVEMVISEDVFRIAEEKGCLWKSLIKRRKERIGHLLRHEEIKKKQ
jgi:hypothetical protein